MTRPIAFALDLDDTLFLERDYVSSCFAWVAETLGRPVAKERLEAAFEKGERDPIGALCREMGIGADEQKRLITDMRAHNPSIALLPDTHRFLERLRQSGEPFYIITNGRSITQRCKITALSLLDAEIIAISEEIGAEKPDQAIYQPVIDARPDAQCVYIGDNPRKDFITPNRLGWLSVMRRHGGRGVHAQNIDVPQACQAHRTVSTLDELFDLISG
jgi:putative hydrolase of the HAD superfamily